MRLRIYIVLCLCLVALSVTAGGADSVRVDTLHKQVDLSEVEVVARQQRSIIPPQQLQGVQLQSLSLNSVADAVRYFSGVQIKDYGGVGGMRTVDVRSMGSHHLGVFYDGIEVGNAQNGTVDLGKFSMDNIESIELYNGQKGDIFQPAKDFGNSGTLYITTRRPHFSPDKSYNIELRMRGGSFGQANPSLLYEQRLSPQVHLTTNAEYTYATGRYPFRYQRQYVDGTTAWDTTAVRQNGDIQAFRAEAGLYGYTDNSKWHVRGYYYQAERGIPGAIVNNVWMNSQRQWDRNAFVQGNYTISLPLQGTRGVDVQANLKYSNDKLRYLNPDTTLQYVDNTFLQQEVYASLASCWHIRSWWDVSVAADYQLGWLSSNRPLFANPRRHTFMVSAATAMSYRWIKAQASLLETHTIDHVDPQSVAAYAQRAERTHYNALTPMVLLNVKPLLFEEWYLRTYYKSAYRLPTFNDLYYQDNGVADLKPEHTRQLDLGTEWQEQFKIHNSKFIIGLKADAYYNRVSNKIIAVPKGNSQYRWAMMNIGEVQIFGTELATDLTFRISGKKWKNGPINGQMVNGHMVNLHLSYTYQRAQDITDPLDNDPYFGTWHGQIAYIPRHSCSATATYTWRGLNVAYSFVYVGGRYTSSSNIRENYIQPWYTHDLSASYTFHFSKVGCSIGAELNNLFNQQYEVIPNYPMPGINGKGILKIIL